MHMNMGPWQIMETVILILGGVLIAYLKIRPFIEKPAKEPEKTVFARLISKEVKTGTFDTGRSNRGYNYVLYFMTEEGQKLELFSYEIEFGRLSVGMQGMLTYKGRYFVRFVEEGKEE